MKSILVLHGFRHNSKLLQKSMDTIIRKFKSTVNFVFYDSPIKFVDIETKDADFKTFDTSELLQWWSATKDSVLTLEKFDTYNESMKNVRDKWNSGKYDGIMGFSQGSVLAQLFCWNAQAGLIELKTKPKFAILCSTFPVTDLELKKFYKDKLNIPSVIMYGTNDTYISDTVTMAVANNICSPFIIKHDGGHYVSTKKNVIDELTTFFNLL